MAELVLHSVYAKIPVSMPRTGDFVRIAKPPITHRAYRSVWIQCEFWRQTRGQSPFPPEPEILVSTPPTPLRHAAGTIARRPTSIASAHQSITFTMPATNIEAHEFGAQ